MTTVVMRVKEQRTMAATNDNAVTEHYDQQRRYVIEALLCVESARPRRLPNRLVWQSVVAGLAEILGVEPAAFAVRWFESMLDGHPDPVNYLERARLPEAFERAVLAEIEAHKETAA
jgi:hypothetical protein